LATLEKKKSLKTIIDGIEEVYLAATFSKLRLDTTIKKMVKENSAAAVSWGNTMGK